MKLNYKQKIFLYFFIVFALFTGAVVLFEDSREHKYKKEIFESDQKVYTEFVHLYLIQNNIGFDNIDELKGLLPLLPPRLRISIIKDDGTVIFDNDINTTASMANHLDRPEIQKAKVKEFGSDIRKSASLDNKEFMYYAIHYDGFFIRIASPYDVLVKDFFKSDNVFLYFIIFLFFAVLIALIYISNRFGKSIAQLKDFVVSARDEKADLQQIDFHDDELGEIGKEIVLLYKKLEDNRKKLLVEKEKLLQHFQSVEEGVCFFTSKRKKLYSNSHFMQYLNALCDRPTLNVDAIFHEEIFIGLQNFLNKPAKGQGALYDEKIEKGGKYYQLKSVRFEDNSFEVTIDNITKMEKTRLLKQEMTNSIAHELRTPVTSIRGYLETLKEQSIDAEKRQFFIDRSYAQIIRLSELIQDISVLTRIEEASDRFEIEPVGICSLLDELRTDLSDRFQEHHIDFKLQVDESVKIEGNRMLLYSIFRNLADNSIAHAGDDISINICSYMEDNEYYYFSYYDTGSGVEEKYLSRLFERFYRVNEGRTRDTGGSGLGLSIVKNAVLFHKGEITAKNRKEGGLEFLFTLKKTR